MFSSQINLENVKFLISHLYESSAVVFLTMASALGWVWDWASHFKFYIKVSLGGEEPG